MIKIPKQDAFEIRKICGMRAICSSHSKHKSYYLVENPKYIQAYRELKNFSISK